MKNHDHAALVATLIFLAAMMLIMSIALTNRIRRLENEVEDLRVRVIYGVKP